MVIALPLVALGCGSGEDGPRIDGGPGRDVGPTGGCPTGQTCCPDCDGTCFCVAAGGGCPGFACPPDPSVCTTDADCSPFERCDPCATSSCPVCTDCVAGCVTHPCSSAAADGLLCDCTRPTDCGASGVAVIQDGCWTCVDYGTCEPRPGGCDAATGVTVEVVDGLFGVSCAGGGDQTALEIVATNSTDTPLPFSFDAMRVTPVGGGTPFGESATVVVASVRGDIDAFTGTLPALGAATIRVTAPLPATGLVVGADVRVELDVTADAEPRTVSTEPVVANACEMT
jgi:hypothetical protein